MPNFIEAKSSPIHKRGVFATTDIAAGALIERCPVVVISAERWPFDTGNLLHHYLFRWPIVNDGVQVGEGLAVAFGFGSLYNHSYSPNATREPNPADECIAFFAMRDIAAGEEILFNYNRDPGDKSPLWFSC